MSDPTPSTTFRAGLVQMCSGRDVEKNVRDASQLIREAAKAGALYVQTPECTTFMDLGRESLFAATLPEAGNPALDSFRALARELAVWLHIGSMAVRVSLSTIEVP